MRAHDKSNHCNSGPRDVSISLSGEYKYSIRFLKVALCLFDSVRQKPVVLPLYRIQYRPWAHNVNSIKKNSRVRHVYNLYSTKKRYVNKPCSCYYHKTFQDPEVVALSVAVVAQVRSLAKLLLLSVVNWTVWRGCCVQWHNINLLQPTGYVMHQ